jgi:ATP-dependent DNA helicase RecG
LEEALQFVRKHLPLAAKIMEGEVERLETPLIPFKAIREAMINALCHKDYSLYGGSIGLAIYDDRMELFNDGGLLPEVTIQKIKSGYSKLRNPLMAEILYKAGLVEKWGRGIQEIIRQCIHAGAPEPEFLVDEEDFKIIFPFPKSLSPLLPASGHAKGKVLSKRQEAILKILSKAEFLKATEIRSQLQEPPSERTLRDDLKVLKEAGQIGSQGHAKTALWFLIKS